jgi:predicted nucleotidyltransferase
MDTNIPPRYFQDQLQIPKKGIIIPFMGIISTGLADALFSKVQQRVLGLLFVNADRSFYTNEIVRFVDSGIGVVQRELEKLAASGLVTIKKIGNQKHYQANHDTPIFAELRGIMLKTVGLADILRLALLPLSDKIQTAFIYGSIAKGSDTSKSDIDVLIVGKELAYADVYGALGAGEASAGRPVNPSIYSQDELKRKLTEDNAFVSRVLEQPKIFLIGSEDDLPKS